MNLHGIVANQIGAVNPFITGTVRFSTGSTTSADKTRVPTYRDVPNVKMQVQSLSSRDLQQIEGLNLNGEKRKIYFYGEIDAIVRSANKGGDLVVISSGVNAGTWLVVTSLEQFPDWCSAAVVLQNGS
jgi:hypothetical protein